MKLATLSLILLLAVGIGCLPAPSALAQGAVFNDSGPEKMTLANSYYAIVLSKTNGAITSIVDQTTGRQISAGSRYGCLWGAFGAQAPYVGGCSYPADRFSYSWDAAQSRLTLRYAPDPAAPQRVAATVTLSASNDHWFDLRLQLTHQAGADLDYVQFPSDLVLAEADILAAYLPALPGVRLEPAFFAQDRSYLAGYPGQLFADFIAIESQAGTIAIGGRHDGASIQPLTLGLNHDDDFMADSSYCYRSYAVGLPAGATWSTPTVRLRVGQPLADLVYAYRGDSGIDTFAGLATKAGDRYQQLAQSPLLKADTTHINLPFAQYAGLLARLPAPGILHLLAFQPRGFDENYPDLLPPAAEWGSGAELAAMMGQARALGFLTMPYTNPTWWDDESPTMQGIIDAGKLAEVAALDRAGVPIQATYGGHGGYVVAPYAPLVTQRLGRLVDEMTVTLPGDLIFEDQVGARALPFDYSPSAPGPTAYAQGWLEHTRAHRAVGLMTEQGFDRLAETELGFHGSLLLDVRNGVTDGRWGAGAWSIYPLAPMLLRDKVLLYQHNLAPETFTNDMATLAWNMAFGYQLSYDLGASEIGGGPDNPWLALVSAFQRHVLARYAGERMLSYTRLGPAATLSSFERFAVIANWSADAAYAAGAYTLPPQGAMATALDGSLTAGVFTSYNGQPLADGLHYLIEARDAGGITVRQPMGADTALSIRLPGIWLSTVVPKVVALGADGAALAEAPATRDANTVSFSYRAQIAEGAVAAYRIDLGDQAFLPLVAR